MTDNDNRYKLWQTISKEYDLPDYNQFSKDMEDATKRKSLHDAVSAEYDLPDFDQFSKDMGYGQQTTQQINQNAQNDKKPQQTAQSSHVEEGRGLSSDNGYSKQKTAFDKAAEQAWNKLAHKRGIKWTIEGHPEVKMVAVTDDLLKKFPQLEQMRGYQVPFNMSTGTPIMQNIDDKGNIITPDEASEQYTKILTNQDFDYVPKQEPASVQIGSVVNTALSTKGGWLDRMARKSMAQYGDDWEHQKFESDGKEVSSSDVFGKVKQTIYDYYNSVLKGIRTHLMFNSDEEKQAYVDNLYKTGQLKEEDIPKANVLHYVQNVDKEEQIEAVRQATLNRQLELEMAQERFNQLPQREKGESDFDYNDRILHEGALYEQDIRKLKKQIAQLDAVSDELQGNNTSWKEWGHAFKTSGIGSYHAWDLGATDLKDAIELNEVANDMNGGKQMTSSDYMALRVMSQANEADAIENAVMPVSYKSKKGGFISAPFSFGFFVGGNIAEGATSTVNKVVGKVISKAVKGAVLKAGGKKALSAATNLAEKAANTKCVKLFGMLAKDFEKAAFMENTTGAATTGAEILNRHIGTVTESDDGFKMEGESLPTAIIKGEISQNIESQTEFLGEHFPSSLKFIRGMAHTKVGSAIGLRNLAAWLTKVSRTEFATTLKSYATRAGINGVFGEYLEEVAGTAENALLVGDQKFSDLFDVKQQEEVAGSVVLSCLGMGIFGTAIYSGQRGLNMPAYYRLQHIQNKWDNAGLDLFTGEEWAKLKDRIDNTPNEGMKFVMADILRGQNMTEEQMRAAYNYASCTLTLRGMNLGAMKAAQLGLTDDRHIEQDNAYVEGRQAKDEDKHDIQIEFEDRSHELAEKLGISEQQLDNMSDEELESLTGKDDQLDNLIYDYQTSHAKYQGVVDNADDEIDKAAQEAARQTDMATDKSRGTVRNATIKAAKGEEDYGVYIVSGNVATNEDGSINVSESDDMILYYDPKSGKIEHCDAMRLASLGEEVNAEETRNQAIADAKEKAIRQQAGIIDGTVGEGTSFTITDAEGNEHTYEVLADNGDGSAMITMDGNVQDTPVSLQDLQNLKDAEEAKRLEAAKMQRQQYEEEREKQNAPVEDNLDYADIINTNGNVEIAEVVDEEGNAMFPDAEEVFFVQNQGNRAKVMVLDSEGNLQPKLVKKSAVRSLGTMSVDEYRQGRQQALKEAENASGPSLGDETEPSNNVVPTDNITTDNTTTDETQPGNEAEVTTSDETQNISNEQENTPKITLEDGTEVPMLEDGNPDFSQLTAGQVAELYDSQFGEDAGQIITNNVNRSKKALDKANAMTVSGGSFVEQKASKEAKDKAIAEAKEKYDSAKAIADAYNERMLAKEEDTPEGRMNLIEKARRKFNRIKGSVKDNAQAIAQLYDETVGSLLHRLYDSTGIDVFDDTANTVDEYVASSIAPYSLNYEGTETSKGVKQETGLSRSDFAKTGLLAKEGKGKTIGQLANDLWRDRPSNLENITDQDVRNAIIDLITSGQTAFGLKNHIQNLRIAEAENILEQQKRQADELAHAEKQKEEELASTEQADNNAKESSNTEATPADAQEEDKLADMPFEAPSPDEDAPFSAKDKAKDPLEVWNNMTDEEKAAYIENNRVKDTRLVDDVVGKKLRKAIEKIAEMMGATVQWQRTDMIRNGWFNPNTKTIYLALDSSILEGVQFVFGHEMTHEIKSKSPVMYDELKGLVKEKYGEELFEAMTNDNEKRYADVGKTDEDRSYYEEETVADAIGKMINDLNLTHSIALKMSHPLLAKMHDVLLKVKNALMATPYTDDVKGIIRTIEQVYVKTANGTFESSASEGTYGERLSAKKRRALETASLGINPRSLTAISSADGANILQNIDNLILKYKNSSTQPKTFVGEMADALDVDMKDKSSKYANFECKNGNVVTIRISDHNATSSNLDINGQNNAISIVVTNKNNIGIINDGNAHIVEYYYNAIKLRKAEGKPLADIVGAIKQALYSGEFKDPTGLAERQEVNMPNSDENVLYSLRQKPEPEKKGTGYKVFVLGKDGKLYPPMVANPNGAATPVGVWLDADAAPVAGESKTGRPQVKQGGKGTQGGSGKLAYRPGWHLGVIPYAIQFNRKDAEGNKTLFPKNFVFAEVEYAADKDYQDEAHAEGINSNGKYQHSLAGLKHLPTDGYYMYRTNPNPETDPWVITGAMKVNRLLTRAEQADIVRNAGREPQKIQEGDIVTDDVVNSINQEIAAAPKFSLKVYHGSGADFTEFDFDHMGEGAGSQSFGWGGYVTSSKKIGKSYADLNRVRNLPEDIFDTENKKAAASYVQKLITQGYDKESAIQEVRSKYDGFLDNLNHDDTSRKNNGVAILNLKERIATLDEIEEGKLPLPTASLYEVDIPDDNGSNYLEWDAPITDELIDKVAKALPSLRSYDIEDLKKDRTFDNFYKTISMRSVTDDASFNDDKAASKLLSSLGYTGIKYKAGRNFGGAKEGDTNYVIFKPEDMQIVEHEKFSVKSNVDNQGNPLNQDGTLKLDKIKSVDDLTDEDFTNATRNVQLPAIPKNVGDAIGANGKPVIIKKNIFERNYMRHKDVTPELSKKIFKSALYNPDLYGQNQKKTRPYNWVLINTKDEKGNNRTVLLEVNPNKDNVEIVHWHFIDERGLKKIRKQVDREDGQLLILPSDKEEVGALSDPTVNLSAANIANPSETSKGNAEKFSLRLQDAINETDTEPTEAQKKSGNYKKGHVKFGGYDYTIEKPKGSYRSGVDENGKGWKQKMNDTYGYIRGKFGKDGDHLDMFINDKADLDSWNGDVFVVDQVNQDGTFDEHKVMYGYDSLDDAKKAYLSNYEKGWTGLGNITPVSKAGFDKWLDKSNRKLKPFADYADITSKTNMDTAPSSFEEFLEHPAVRYSIRNEKERAAAEVPDNLGEDVRKGIENAGLPMYDYDPTKEGDRSRAFNEAINSSDNIRFSLKEEKEKIVSDAKANGTYMTAPNGEKTKLNAEQWVTVRTTNFKNWFGDWENDPENASKVVDENGEPMVVWHGRSAEFNTFEKKEGVRFIMGLEDKVKAEGFFFSPNKGLAEEFASNSFRHRGGKANVIPCFLNIRKPMDLTKEDYDRIYEDVTGWDYIVGMDTQDNLWGIMDEEGMADKIKGKGYDGVIFVEEVDDSYEPTKISYCALDANQIKSAENNNGDFSADNNDIRFSLKSMMEKPEGWKQANKKAIHIAEAIERDPKFSLKNLDGTLIKAGTYFSGGGLVEEGLKGIIDPVVAVEYDEKISGVYRNNFGNHIVTADVRDVDPKELVGKIDGEVEYFHASPVCKNYSLAKNNHEELELDKETAASTAEFISKVRPKVVTIENVKGYKDSEAMKTITDALDEAGYKWDADVYNAADYGGYTNRERLIVRAVRDGELPAKPEKQKRKSGWYEAVEDIMPTLTEKKNGVAPWMDERLKADGIDWRHIDKPLYVMGSGYANDTVPHAFADELLPTLRTKSGDVIVMPDGKVYRAMGRVLARVSGVSDDYQMPASEALSHTIIGNGIPTQLTENVIAPLVRDVLHPEVEEKASLKDAEYLEAVRSGDMEKAQKMVYDAARAAGYVNGTEYQGEGSWNAPSASVEKKDFANLDALRESVEEYSGDTNVYGIINGVTTNDDDFYYNPGRVGFRDAAASETSSVLRRLRYDKADANTKVKVYRTVPADVKGNNLMSGDWIALSKQYCIEHGNGRYGEGGYRIIEEEVPIKTIWNDGNDMREFGFDDGNNNEAEKNVPNNRKLLDAVTYDNNGNVIPLSERFNESNDDIRYSLKNKDRKQAQLDIILKTNPMLDDYHTGIRKVEDIKTLGESVEEARSEAEKYGDDEWSAYPDITNDMLQNALETGEITIYSSKPIKNGVFVTPSYMQASDYAGGGNVYEKTVPLTDVAWINTDEGQYAKVDGERYSLKEVNDKFNDRLAQLIENPNQKDRVLHLGRSSQFLIDGGIADAEIELDFDKFVRKSSEKYKNNHPFSAGDIKDLPKAIAHPVAVFNSTTKKDHVVMTELNHDGKNFIVAIRATEQNRKNKVVLEVNQITSLYPKGERGIIYWINNNKLSNVDKEKALHFIEALQPHAGTLTSEELSSAANIVRNFVNPKQNDGNLQKTEKYSLRVDRYRDELNQWKKDNNLPKDAERPQLPVREPNESAADFLKRVKEYRKQAALWATAPTYEDHLLVSDTAQGQFNLEMQRKAVLTRIVIQDSMLAIRKAQEAIMKEVGVDKLNFAEDAYTAENRSHGKAKNEFEEYNDEFLQPLRKAYNELMQRLGKSYDNVKVYMIAKHGLERNAYIAFKYALDEDYETNEERMNAYKNYKADMDRLNNDADFEAGRIDFAAWKQRDGFIRTKYAPSYFKFRFDENGMTKDYSGLSALFDADDYEGAAADLVKEVEDANPYYTDELWYATNDATKKILRDSYNAGMMTEDNFNFVSGMYRNYIPLRGWGDTNADQVWNYVGGGKGAFNQVVKEAKGRKSLADDPIAYIENMAESAILMNNRNWVKQHLLLLAQNHRTSLLNVSKAWYIKTKDAQGNGEWIPASPQITEGMTGKQVEAALEAFEQKMEQMKQNGEATQKREHLEISYPQTNGEEREHEVRVMKGGEEYVIYVNGDPQLAQAVNNTRARKVREGLESSISAKVIARTGRYMAAAYTSMSPLFIPSNYMRDLTMTLASTAIREDARYNYLLRRNMLRHWNTFPMVLSYQNGTLREKVRNGSASRVEQMFYDFMMNGGETGFVTSVDVEDLKKKFRNDLKDLNRMAANPKKVGHIIMNSIETLNRAIEDSNRFMVYMTSIEYGRSIEEAVNNAKDVTLNFNRKGTGEHWMQNIRNLYLFINPAIQSLQTLGALAKHHRFKFTTVTTGWLASGLLAPMLNNLLMSFFGGDDDKDKYWQFTKWDRRNNFIMWIPFTKEFVKIPLAQEFRGFYGVGDMIASKLWGGEKAEESWRDYAVDLAGQIVDMLPLDPTGYDGNVLIALMPNVFRPIFELGDNVDFTGKPIFRNSEYNKYDPNFTKAYVGTPDWLVRISKMVNSIDNKYPDVQQNAIDRFGDPRFNLNNPAVVDHVLSSYLGGAYTMGSQILGVATKALNGDDIKMADIPLASKFVSNPDDRPVSKKQGEEFWDMKERHDRAANTLSKLKKKAKVDGDYSTLDIFFGSDEYRQYKEDDKKVKKYEEDRKKEKAQETDEAYRPHKTTADDVYKSHTTPKDDFEDMKMKQLYEKLNSYKIRYEAIDGISGERGDAYYKANKAAIDAIEEIAYDKSQIASIKKGFLSDGQNTYDADGMKDIRELRKRILDVLEKANKAMMNNRK